jgi:hypothetical protein
MAIFIEIENKITPGANFFERKAYGRTQSHGLRFFHFLSFPPCLSPHFFILKQIMALLRGGKVIFSFYAEIYFF